MAAAAKGTPFYVWDVTDGRETAKIIANRGHKLLGWSLALSPHGEMLAAAITPTFLRSLTKPLLTPFPFNLVNEDKISVWRLVTGDIHRQISDLDFLGPGPALGLAFSPNGRYLAAGEVFPYSPQDHLKVWDIPADKVARGFVRDAIAVLAPQFSPQGYLVAQPRGPLTFVKPAPPLSSWNVATGKVVQRYKGCGASLFLAFSLDGQMLAGARGREICLWAEPTGTKYHPIRLRQGPAVAVGFSDDRTLVAAILRYGISVWDLDTRNAIRQCAVPRLVAPAEFSPDGRLLAWGDPKLPVVHLWDVQSCKEIRSVTMPHDAPATQLVQAQ